MNQRNPEILWLAIRILGLFFLAKSLTALPRIPGNLIMLRSVSIHKKIDAGRTDSIPEKLEEYAVANIVQQTAEFLFFGFVGIYFCRGGRTIHRLIRLPREEAGAQEE